MSKYKLVKISPTGIRSFIADDYDPAGLIAAGEALLKKHPGEQFGVADELGFFIWPERWASAHKNPGEA
jgi:hypothetical protein